MTPLHLIELSNVPIFEQLQLEEALLRTDTRNFCLINSGSPPAIVMGISGVPETLIDLQRANIPLLQRFSGGGTVVIDENTLFVTWIFAKDALPIQPFPEPIHRFTAHLFESAWQIPGFHFRENDYAIENLKCGGNAQYIQKDRWLHHTSFLFDYQEDLMNLLLLPPKRPAYRENRPHTEFLSKLKDHAPSKEHLIGSLKKELVKRFYIEECDPQTLPNLPHRKATRQINTNLSR